MVRHFLQPLPLTSRVPAGSSGCGKSVTLIQAVQYASSNNWLVFYFPRGSEHPSYSHLILCLNSSAINTVNSTTAYVYDARTRTYLQPTYAYQTLQRFLTVNSNRLRTLVTQEEISIDKKPSVPKGTPLPELIAMGMKDRPIAPAILSALLKELGKRTRWFLLSSSIATF